MKRSIKKAAVPIAAIIAANILVSGFIICYKNSYNMVNSEKIQTVSAVSTGEYQKQINILDRNYTIDYSVIDGADKNVNFYYAILPKSLHFLIYSHIAQSSG